MRSSLLLAMLISLLSGSPLSAQSLNENDFTCYTRTEAARSSALPFAEHLFIIPGRSFLSRKTY